MVADIITMGVKCVREIVEGNTFISCYNEKGLITDYSASGWDYVKAKYHYDEEDKLIRTEWYRMNPHEDYEGEPPEYKITAFIVYGYDEKGNLIDEKRYEVNNELQEHTLNVYDDLNRLITTKYVHLQQPGIAYCDTCKYDSVGNKIEWERHFLETGARNSVTFKYDENGRVIFSQSGTELDSLRLSTTKYDQYGNIVEIITRDYYGNLLSEIINVYDYDQTGNWIKKKSEERGIPSIMHRAIEYYNVA